MATEVLTANSPQRGVPPSASSKGRSPRGVATFFNYYDDPGDGSLPQPVIIGGGTVSNKRATIKVPSTVTDITGEEDKYTLDGCGFQLCHHEAKSPCQKDGYRDEEKLKEEYFPEMEQLLKDITGASRVFVFDHKVRHGPSNWHNLGAGNSEKRGPLHRVHVDQSYAGAEFLVRWYLPDEADELLKKRWQIINAWRPIRTIYKDPLAVADAGSVAEEDLVAARTVYPTHQRETWTVKPGQGHKWFFKYAQRPDEVMLIKCFDTNTGVARRAPHSAFQDPKHADDDWRESIEIRTMLFYDD